MIQLVLSGLFRAGPLKSSRQIWRQPAGLEPAVGPPAPPPFGQTATSRASTPARSTAVRRKRPFHARPGLPLWPSDSSGAGRVVALRPGTGGRPDPGLAPTPP